MQKMFPLFLLLTCLLSACLSPQSPGQPASDAAADADVPWQRDTLDPAATELWAAPRQVSAPADAPPADAIVLLDSSGHSAWEGTRNGQAVGWTFADGVLTIAPGSGDIRTRQAFGSIQLHLEFRIPAPENMEGPTGQGRGNSGIFFMERYELQVLDSHGGTTYSNGQCGAIYKQHAPLVNASRPPQTWQTYDVVFMAPVFSESGQVLRPATLTAFHNGVLIHNHSSILGPVEYRGLPQYQSHADKLPLRLQDHGNPVSYRNIWLREL